MCIADIVQLDKMVLSVVRIILVPKPHFDQNCRCDLLAPINNSIKVIRSSQIDEQHTSLDTFNKQFFTQSMRLCNRIAAFLSELSQWSDFQLLSIVCLLYSQKKGIKRVLCLSRLMMEPVEPLKVLYPGCGTFVGSLCKLYRTPKGSLIIWNLFRMFKRWGSINGTTKNPFSTFFAKSDIVLRCLLWRRVEITNSFSLGTLRRPVARLESGHFGPNPLIKPHFQPTLLQQKVDLLADLGCVWRAPPPPPGRRGAGGVGLVGW